MAIQLKPEHLRWGIIALVLVAPVTFFPSLINMYRLPKVVVINFLVTALLGLWLFVLREERGRPIVFPLVAPITLYIGISAISLTAASNAAEGLLTLSQEILYISLFFVVANLVRSRDQAERILLWTITSGVIVSLIGIYQRFGGDIPGLVNIAPPGSTFGNKNVAAQYILLLLPLPYLFLLSANDKSKELLYSVGAGIMTTYFLYTGTRAAWAGFLLACLAILILVRLKEPYLKPHLSNFRAQMHQRRPTFVGILLFVIAMNWVPPYFVPNWNQIGFSSPIARFATLGELDQDSSFIGRLAIWSNTLEIFRDHPVVGIGKGNFKIAYPRYARRRVHDPSFGPDVQPREAHNDYVQLLAETGVFGLLTFLSIPILLGVKVWRSIPEKREAARCYLIAALSWSLFSVLVVAFLDFPFELPVSEVFFWLLAGLLWVSCENNSVEEDYRRWRISSLAWQRGCVGFLFSLSLLFSGVHSTLLRAEIHFSRGMRWLSQKNWDQADQEFRKAEFLNPWTYRHPFARGLLYLETGNYPDAIQANLRALDRHPNYINAYNNLGVAYARAGRLRGAEQAWKKSLEIWPDHNEPRNNLATLYASQGRRAEAIALLKESLTRHPDDDMAKQKLKNLLGEDRLVPKF